MKNYDKWNYIKKKVDDRKRTAVKLGEIFWCNLGINIGVEQNGDAESFHRPILIIKKFSRQMVLVAPLTKKLHAGNWYFDIKILREKQQVILNQIRPINTKRLTKSIGQISMKEVHQIVGVYIELVK